MLLPATAKLCALGATDHVASFNQHRRIHRRVNNQAPFTVVFP